MRDPQPTGATRQEGNPVTDPLGDAITVLENVRIEMPSARRDTEDAQNRVNLALEYLRMIGTIRAQALVEYARQRSDREDVIEALNELELLVTFREPAPRYIDPEILGLLGESDG